MSDSIRLDVHYTDDMGHISDEHVEITPETARQIVALGLDGISPKTLAAIDRGMADSLAGRTTPMDFSAAGIALAAARSELEEEKCNHAATANALDAARADLAAERERREKAESDAAGRARFELWYGETVAERDQKAEECEYYLSDAKRLAGELLAARAEVAALKAVKVKLPTNPYSDPTDYAGVWHECVIKCADAIRAAGVEVDS